MSDNRPAETEIPDVKLTDEQVGRAHQLKAAWELPSARYIVPISLTRYIVHLRDENDRLRPMAESWQSYEAAQDRKAELLTSNERLTRDDQLFIAMRLMSRARHSSKKIANANGKPLHPELLRQLHEDVAECTRLALLLQTERVVEAGRTTFQVRNGPVSMPCDHCGLSVSDHLCPPVETSAGDRATATACEIIRTFEHALVKIDTYSPASTVQPVQIAREALTKAYGPDYRSAVKTSVSRSIPVPDETLDRSKPEVTPKCLVADCPEPTADGQAMCTEHMKWIEQ